MGIYTVEVQYVTLYDGTTATDVAPSKALHPNSFKLTIYDECLSADLSWASLIGVWIAQVNALDN